MIFKQYYHQLVNYCFTIVKDRDDAEDIVQQTFTAFWQKRDQIEIQTSAKAYLFKSVYHAGLNKIKQNNVRTTYANDVRYTTPSFSDTQGEHYDLKQKMEESIDKLPEQCGKIFRMSRFDELKYQEIADRLGISVKTVENQMGKALKLMREMLKDYLVLIIVFLSEIC